MGTTQTQQRPAQTATGSSHAAPAANAELHLNAADVLETMMDGFLALDHEWRVIYVNAQTCRMSHKEPQDFLGKVLWEKWPAIQGTQIEREYRRAVAEGVPVQFEYDYAGARPVCLEIHAYPTEDGLNTFFRDITERKQQEQERQEFARRQRAFLRDVLAGVTEGRLRLCDEQSPLPPALATPCGEPINLTAATLTNLRARAQAAAQEAGYAPERAFALVSATSECAMNAVVHAGGGVGRVSVANGDRVQVRVEDHGHGIAVEALPRATLEKGYTTAGTMGYGFKMMLEAVDRVWLQTGPEGTTVVLEQDRLAANPLGL